MSRYPFFSILPSAFLLVANAGRSSWSVSYHVYVPRRSNLQAVTKNGGVSAQQVEGTMEFEATNGGISLD